MPAQHGQHPLLALPGEDLELITELVLASGSLKDVAARYDVSYPTLRARLDRVIERLRAAIDGRPRDPMTDLLASLVERGELSAVTARSIRDLSRKKYAPRSGA
jgi:hypothetical protein